jgi:hypothetical protein
MAGPRIPGPSCYQAATAPSVYCMDAQWVPGSGPVCRRRTPGPFPEAITPTGGSGTGGSGTGGSGTEPREHDLASYRVYN